MERLLRAGHWQFFTVGFVIPFLLFLSGFVVPAYHFMPAYMFFVFPLAVIITQLILYMWMWSIGGILFRHENLDRFFSNRLFRVFVWVPVVLILIIAVLWLWGASILGMGKFSMADILYRALWYVIPLQFVLIISKFYCFYFVARVIRSAELKRPASFDESISIFILILVFPIGIWFLQPRVNQLSKNKST